MTALLIVLTIVICLFVELHLSRRRRRVGEVQAPGLCEMSRPFAPYGTFLAPTHGWLRIAADGAFLVGVDDLVTGALGEIEAVELPPIGTQLGRGEALATLRAGGQRLVIPCPAAGEVVQINGAAVADAARIGTDPYGLGWLLKLRTANHKAAIDPLHFGDGALAFLRREYRRLIDLVVTTNGTPAMTQLADGGVLERGAVTRIGPLAVERFQADFLPVTAPPASSPVLPPT